MASNATRIKAANRRTLLLTLLRHQPISRVRLARRTGLSTTTVTNLVAPLVDQGIVAEVGTDRAATSAGAGRPPMALALVPESRCALGIHIGVRTAQVALGALDARLLARRTVEHRPGERPEDTIQRLAVVARELIEEHAPGPDCIAGVGVGASGLVDRRGINVWSPNLGWRDVPIAALLGEALGLPVAVENNVRCMALAESTFGAGQGKEVLAFVYARVGVGAGLVVDGKIYRGAGDAAGEIGHWTILPQGGEPCRCGNSGCLETLISELVIVDRARHLAPVALDNGTDPLEATFAAARAGNRPLCGMLAERAEYVGIALANLVNVLNPQMILLGGLLYQGYDLLQPVIEETLRRRTFGGKGAQVALRPATYGESSGAVGAVTLALDAFFLGRISPARIG